MRLTSTQDDPEPGPPRKQRADISRCWGRFELLFQGFPILRTVGDGSDSNGRQAGCADSSSAEAVGIPDNPSHGENTRWQCESSAGADGHMVTFLDGADIAGGNSGGRDYGTAAAGAGHPVCGLKDPRRLDESDPDSAGGSASQHPAEGTGDIMIRISSRSCSVDYEQESGSSEVLDSACLNLAGNLDLDGAALLCHGDSELCCVTVTQNWK